MLRWAQDGHPTDVDPVPPGWRTSRATRGGGAGVAHGRPERRRRAAAWGGGPSARAGGQHLANLCTILRQRAALHGPHHRKRDGFAVRFEGKPTTDNIGRWRELLEREHGISPGADAIRLARQTVAEWSTAVHPAQGSTSQADLGTAAKRPTRGGKWVILGADGDLPGADGRSRFGPPSPARSSPGAGRHGPCSSAPGARKSTFSTLAGEVHRHARRPVEQGRLLQLAVGAGCGVGRDRARHRAAGAPTRSVLFMSSRVDRFRRPTDARSSRCRAPRRGREHQPEHLPRRRDRVVALLVCAGCRGVEIEQSRDGATSSGRALRWLSRPVSPGGSTPTREGPRGGRRGAHRRRLLESKLAVWATRQ